MSKDKLGLHRPTPLEMPLSTVSVPPAPAPHDEERLLRNRNFLWICLGVGVVMLGSQFTTLALPWLVLKITGDPLAMATVVIIAGVPQIFLLLFGSGLADRYPTKRILTWSYLSCSALLLLLSTLLFTDRLELWMVDVFAFSTGLVFGVSVPASFSLIPAALPKSMIPAASSAVGSIRQVFAFIGPLLAGALLGLSHDQGLQNTALQAPPDLRMFAIAFLIDGLGLAFVAWTVVHIAFRPRDERAATIDSGFNIMPAVRWFLGDRETLTILGYWMLISFVLSGPVRIALPLLAEQSTGLGAQAYGALVSSNAAGVFIGMTALGLLRVFVLSRLWSSILLLDAVAAVLVMAIGWIRPELQFAIAVYVTLLLLVGTRTGFVEIGWFSSLQQRYPDEIRGRAISIFMVVSTINISASVALSGWLTRHMPAKELFILAGAMTLLVVVVCALLRAFGVLRIEA